jgi:phosphoglycolate phosphatase-like HAD superfamily hydrolase
MVGAIVGSCKREPTTVGKPSGFMLDNIASTLGLERDEICMVGDRLDTDIMFGKNGGLRTALVLSGALMGVMGLCAGGSEVYGRVEEEEEEGAPGELRSDFLWPPDLY